VGDRLTVCATGPTPYREGLALQDALVRARADGRTGDWLLYPDHPPVLTMGRSGTGESLLADAGELARAGIEVFEVPRGGDVTWHGPGQLVGYPIVALDRVDRDLHRWLRTLEEAILRALAHWGLQGERREGLTGVWLGREKIASLGVAVRRWVAYHGFALNVRPDLSGFSLIHPCGLKGIRMTSLAERLGDRAPGLPEARAVVTGELVALLGYDGWDEVPAGLARAFQSTPGSADDSRTGDAPGATVFPTRGVSTW
jgi:lipoate-protein ligase B